eukprot:g14820.t1
MQGMAMPGGGHGGYGSQIEYQDANGHHGGGGGHHTHNNGNGAGGGSVNGIEHGHELADAEEGRRLKAYMEELDVECERCHHAANETQTLLENRAIARLATEVEAKEIVQQHEEKLKMYRIMEIESKEACVIGDNRIKLLQERQERTNEDMRKQRDKMRQMIETAKVAERKAIMNEERRRHASTSASGAGAGVVSSSSDGGAAKPAAGAPAASYNGGGMFRRMQSSSGARFAPRRASTGTEAGAGTAQRSRRPQAHRGSSGVQPKPVDQMRQTFMEDTLTDFFGL